MKPNSKTLLLAAWLCLPAACAHPTQTAPVKQSADGLRAGAESQPAGEPDDSWLGLYTSPAEIGGFTGTALAIERGYDRRLEYRMTFYSDVLTANAIKEPEKHGDILTAGERLYLPTALGYYTDGQPHLLADITRYTRLKINGRTVLLRDDALQAYREQNQLYDYGILIKVRDQVEKYAGLEKAPHESIKILYRDPAQEWQDPFVHGPNKR